MTGKRFDDDAEVVYHVAQELPAVHRSVWERLRLILTIVAARFGWIR